MGHLRTSQEEIRDALDMVVGVTGFVDAPSILKPGIGFSRLVGMEAQGTPGIFLFVWEVVIITGSTPVSALAAIDDQMGDLVSALGHVVFIRSVGLAQLETGSEPLYGITMNCVKE
jgi:hypothetical protein